MQNIPTLLMFALVISHTLAIAFLKKRRNTLDAATVDGAAKVKQLNLIITVLYIEIPVLTAIIWFIVKPALMQAGA